MVVTAKTFLLSLSVLLFCIVFAVNGQSNELTADIGDKRYVFKRQKVNWFKANHACSALGMSLASVESETEYDQLTSYLFNKKRLSDQYWLSGSNLGDSTNTEYTWLSSGNKLDYTNWETSPSSSNQNYCIFTTSLFKWDTASCSNGAKYYICSRPLVPNCGITGRCKRNRSFD